MKRQVIRLSKNYSFTVFGLFCQNPEYICSGVGNLSSTTSRDGILYTSNTEENGGVLANAANDGTCHRNGLGLFDGCALTMNPDVKQKVLSFSLHFISVSSIC